MGVSGFPVLFMLVGTSLILLAFSGSSSSWVLDVVYHGNIVAAGTSNRKQEEINDRPSAKMKRDRNNIDLEDYHRIDPVPCSKAAINSGPIEHGTPLMPYIPKPAPPTHPTQPKHDVSP